MHSPLFSPSRVARISAIATLAFLSIHLAWAGRPLQTEDAGILDRGACELESVRSHQRADGNTDRENSIQLGCGVGLSTQLALAFGQARVSDASAHGMQFSGKTGLWQGAGDNAPGFSVAYVVTSSKDNTHGWRHEATDVNFVYSQPLNDYTLHANLGPSRDEVARLHKMNWALALEHADIGAWAPMAEIYGDNKEPPWWNLGLRYTAVPNKLELNASFGRQVVTGRPTLITFGLKYSFCVLSCSEAAASSSTQE
jgi:hypothetical protein